MMSDIALMLEEIRNKLDSLEHKVDQINIFPQVIVCGDDNSKPVKLEEIKPTEIFPHQITEDEYKEDSRYAKIEIIYYEVDGVFATFDYKLVEYLNEEYFGIDNLNSFYDCNTYLRDETIHVDYHMVYEGCTSYFAEHKGE
jgi:hypothetical protein